MQTVERLHMPLTGQAPRQPPLQRTPVVSPHPNRPAPWLPLVAPAGAAEGAERGPSHLAPLQQASPAALLAHDPSLWPCHMQTEREHATAAAAAACPHPPQRLGRRSAALAGPATGAPAPARPRELRRPAATPPVMTTHAALEKPEGVGAGCDCAAAASSISMTVLASLAASNGSAAWWSMPCPTARA